MVRSLSHHVSLPLQALQLSGTTVKCTLRLCSLHRLAALGLPSSLSRRAELHIAAWLVPEPAAPTRSKLHAVEQHGCTFKGNLQNSLEDLSLDESIHPEVL